MADPYRDPPPGMPSVEEVNRRECRHPEYRNATKSEQRQRPANWSEGMYVNFICLSCGQKLWW